MAHGEDKVTSVDETVIHALAGEIKARHTHCVPSKTIKELKSKLDF